MRDLNSNRGGGDFRFPRPLSVSQSVPLSSSLSVCLSVHSVSVHWVFRTFLSRPLIYWLEIWYMNLSSHNTDRVWVLSCLTYFYRSYCPLLKFSFPDFSLLLWDIDLEFCIWICLNIIQIEFEFRHAWPLRRYCPLLKFSFPQFSLLSFEILTWTLVYEIVLR